MMSGNPFYGKPVSKEEAEEADERVNPLDEKAKVDSWRAYNMICAGFTVAHAKELSEDRLVDLHEAVRLVRKAGSDIAYRILS